MSKHLVWLAVPLLLGCSPSRPPGEVSISQAYAPEVKACALGVPETRIVGVEDTPLGADVVFTTSSKRLEELRSRIRDQAAIHGPDAHKGAGHGGVHGAAQAHGMRLWDMPVLAASEVDIVGGALLRVVASDPEHAVELRARVRERVATLEGRGCP